MIIDGKKLASRVLEKVKVMVEGLSGTPGMAAILVGDDPASHLYVSMKEKMCGQMGIYFEKHLYPASVNQNALIEKIEELNQRNDIDGILVQVPLPNQDPDVVIGAIHPDKDIDGFHPESLRRLEAGEPGLVAPVALGIMKLVDEANSPPFRGGAGGGERSASLICSDFFARPLIALLKERGVETIKDSRQADIVIIALGKPKYLTAEMIKPGAIVIDVGTTKTAAGLFGDVDFSSVEPIAGGITPVPGGVGPMTVAMLMLNVVKAHHLRRRSSEEILNKL